MHKIFQGPKWTLGYKPQKSKLKKKSVKIFLSIFKGYKTWSDLKYQTTLYITFLVNYGMIKYLLDKKYNSYAKVITLNDVCLQTK